MAKRFSGLRLRGDARAMIDLRDPNEPWLTSCLHPYPVFITAQEAGYVPGD